MANYYSACRTNYFKVKDAEEFLKVMETIPNIEVIHEPEGAKYAGKFVILGDDPDGGDWPCYSYDQDTGEETEIDITKIISEHLIDGEVAIFMDAGAEKLRYVAGSAFAINNKGESKSLRLWDIYDMARELTDRPKDVTLAEY